MRAATALIVLFSVLSAPIASAVCRDCCNQSVENQLPLCHDKAHAHLGPHVHQLNHVHMVMQDSEASVALTQCNQLQDHLSCRSAACRSAKPMQAFAASVPARQRQIPSHPIATTLSSSFIIAGPLRPPGVCRIAISSYYSASAPLRI
jgi:hypothetical protein